MSEAARAVPTDGLVMREVSYASPDATRLITALQADYIERYGGPDETPVDSAQFAPPSGVFVLAYLDGVAVAMGGYRLHATMEDGKETGSTDAEIKRMYVDPSMRGRGYARRVLGDLEERARKAGASRVILETGERQPEAIALYTSSGYRPIKGFGYYRDMPLSVCFAKQLER
jgi:GNAT superfamily N-acetyltransferase